jgi:hypothetical protein
LGAPLRQLVELLLEQSQPGRPVWPSSELLHLPPVLLELRGVRQQLPLRQSAF